MRLFIAFDISEEARKELARLQSDLRKTDSNLSPVKGFHLTLKFLGEVDEKRIGEIREKLDRVSFEKFRAGLGGAGVFPSENCIKVVWAGLEPKEKINALQQRVEESLKGLFERDNRFHPHLTLARVKFVKDKKGFISSIKNLKPAKISFEVNSFKLIKSTLTPEGPVYEVLEEFRAK